MDSAFGIFGFGDWYWVDRTNKREVSISDRWTRQTDVGRSGQAVSGGQMRPRAERQTSMSAGKPSVDVLVTTVHSRLSILLLLRLRCWWCLQHVILDRWPWGSQNAVACAKTASSSRQISQNKFVPKIHRSTSLEGWGGLQPSPCSPLPDLGKANIFRQSLNFSGRRQHSSQKWKKIYFKRKHRIHFVQRDEVSEIRWVGCVWQSNLEWNSIIYNVNSFSSLYSVRLDQQCFRALSKIYISRSHPL